MAPPAWRADTGLAKAGGIGVPEGKTHATVQAVAILRIVRGTPASAAGCKPGRCADNEQPQQGALS